MKKKFILFVIVVFNSLFFGCKSKDESAEFFKRGVYHFKKNENDKALHLFNEAIKKNTDFADAYLNRGIIYQNNNELEKALEDFQKAVKLDPNFHEAKFNLAKLLSIIGKWPEANELFKGIELKYGKSSEFYGYYGQNQILNSENILGKTNLVKAINLNPKNKLALSNLGYWYQTKNQIDSAKSLFAKALAIDPNFSYALNNQAFLLIRDLKPKEAISLLEKAVNNEPTNLIFINNLSLAYLENKNLVLAAQNIDKAKKLSDNNPYTLRNEAVLFNLKNNNKEAFSILSKLHDTNPEVEYLYYYLTKINSEIADSQQTCYYYDLCKKINEPWLGRLKVKCGRR